MSEITLYYFDTFGRAETTRIILKYLGVEFNDVRLNDEEWEKLKSSGICEFGQIPLLKIDGLNLVQSRAIEKYLLRKYNLYPLDPIEIYQTESLVGLFDDIIERIHTLNWPQQDIEGIHKFYYEVVPDKLKLIENRLNPHNLLVSSTPTHADFVIFEFIYDYFLIPIKSPTMRPILEINTPRLIQFAENFKNSYSNLHAYLSTREDRNF